jgi:hypothetical protein
MKKITLLITLMISSLGFSQTSLPITFTDANQLMSTDGGTMSSLVPDPSDAANQVMKMIGGIDTWDNAQIILSPAVDLSNDAANTITFRINPIGISGKREHLLKFELASNKDINGAVDFSTTDSGWQTITANFPTGLGSYDKMVLFTDAGNWDNSYSNINTGSYLVDDIKFATSLSIAKFDKSNIKMYPNPTKNTLTIEANSTIQKISVYNILGQEVMAMSPINNSATLQTSALQKGVYMLKTDVNGNSYTSKIIKE